MLGCCVFVRVSPCRCVGVIVRVSDARVLCVFVRVSPCPSVGALVSVLECQMLWCCVCLCVCHPVRLWVRWCQCPSVRYPGVVAGCSEVFSPTLDYRGRGNNPLHVLSIFIELLFTPIYIIMCINPLHTTLYMPRFPSSSLVFRLHPD